MKDDPETPAAAAEQSAESNAAAPNDLEARFQQLAAQWKTESLFLSSSTAMAELPSYQKIIALGLPVVPLLLRELDREPDHWFWAPQGSHRPIPIPDEQRGKIREMAQTWVQWGREHGYRW